ncbi:Aste57867_15936 [Aphanomyces stellatus]|uniref:Aste57867_15936 protein n=1 Tax=Aphanomyces stellatus TaxID=120398 RepID=A0A485L5L5_9STRA|nr:hypothetical protein As57867_015880 [Aphanomyces stellatus]VFT92722.1 Aste57867_15936 [Aphanomyces stellatus]
MMMEPTLDDKVVVTAPVVDTNDADASSSLIVGQWKSGIFACMDHIVPNCLVSILCPCVALGQLAARLGLGDCVVVSLVSGVLYCFSFGALVICTGVWLFRTRLRLLCHIPGSVVDDCVAAFCCHCCVLAQMASHVGTYTPGHCTLAPKRTLPGYTALLDEPQPLAAVPASPSV